MLQVARGERIHPVPVFAPARCVVTTVIAAAGYPATPRTGDVITLPATDVGEWLFHAGTTTRETAVVASGGRVLAATATGATLHDAQQRSTALAARVQFRGAFFRRDIGWRALQRGA